MFSKDLKQLLDEKYLEYNKSEFFIETDPIQIPKCFEEKEDIEIAGFLAASLAWGQRPTIIKKCKELMQLMDYAPHDFVMQAEFGEVGGVAPFRCKCAHGVYGRRLVVVRPSVHALNAKALVDPQQLDRREVQLLLGGSFRNGPVEVLASDEIGQADARDKVGVVLPRVIDLAIGAVLPPEALEWRHDEVEIAFDFTRPLLRHLDGIGNAVGHRQRVLLRATFGIGIALAPHGNVAHRRNDQNARLVRRFARDVVAHRRR